MNKKTKALKNLYLREQKLNVQDPSFKQKFYELTKETLSIIEEIDHIQEVVLISKALKLFNEKPGKGVTETEIHNLSLAYFREALELLLEKDGKERS